MKRNWLPATSPRSGITWTVGNEGTAYGWTGISIRTSSRMASTSLAMLSVAHSAVWVHMP